MQLKEDTVNMSNVLPESTMTTVQNLLDDDDFSDEPAMSPYQNDDNTSDEYYNCLDLFIKGEPKQCLEAMLSCGLLNESQIFQNMDSVELFINACSRVSDLATLGISLQNKIIQLFIYSEILEFVRRNSPAASALALITKLHGNLIRAIGLMRGSRDERYQIIADEKDALIHDIGFHVKKRTNESRRQYNVEMLMLAELYLFDVQIQLEGKKKSPKLYADLCDKVLQLKCVFDETVLDEKPLSQIILAMLEQKKDSVEKKKSSSRKSLRESTKVLQAIPTPSDEVRDQIKMDNLALSKGAFSSITSHIPQKWLKALTTQKWIYKNMKQLSLVLVVAVILLVKRYRMITKWFGEIPSTLSQLKPAIVEILRLLSSL